MSSTYSAINDLYGVNPAPRRQRRSGLGWLVVAALAGAFLYMSVHPVMRLRSAPPPDFAPVAGSRTAATGAQKTLARSYWNLASEYVAGKYSYGDALPVNPPADFTLGGDPGSAALYWQRFRELWSSGAVWATAYQFDTRWIGSLLDSLREAVQSGG